MSTLALNFPMVSLIESLKGRRLQPPPNRPEKPSKWKLLLLALLSLLLPGCATQVYQAVPECTVIRPMPVEKFLNASADERLVLQADLYIAQVKAVGSCNNTIRLVNASNRAVAK